MKKLLLALFIGLVMLACTKSDDNNTTDGRIPASQVPAPVISTFTARYPAATGQIEWQIEQSNTYKVKFFIGGQRWQAQFKLDGTFIDEQMIGA